MSKSKSIKPRVNRKLDAAKLASAGNIAELSNGSGWLVSSQSGRGTYTVRLENASPLSDVYSCTCPDSSHRGRVCKHQLSVILWTRANAHAARVASSESPSALIEAIAETTAKVTAARDAFTRCALLCLLAALGYQNDLAYALEYSRAA